MADNLKSLLQETLSKDQVSILDILYDNKDILNGELKQLVINKIINLCDKNPQLFLKILDHNYKKIFTKETLENANEVTTVPSTPENMEIPTNNVMEKIESPKKSLKRKKLNNSRHRESETGKKVNQECHHCDKYREIYATCNNNTGICFRYYCKDCASIYNMEKGENALCPCCRDKCDSIYCIKTLNQSKRENKKTNEICPECDEVITKGGLKISCNHSFHKKCAPKNRSKCKLCIDIKI